MVWCLPLNLHESSKIIKQYKLLNYYPRKLSQIISSFSVNDNMSEDAQEGLVSLFNGISTLFRLFNAKAILLEEQ